MIIKLIEDYLQTKLTELNSQLNTAIILKRVVTETDLSMIGASESYIHYQLFVTSAENDDIEWQGYDRINVRLDFTFLVANKDNSVYQKIFDRYIFPFRRILKNDAGQYSNEDISSSLMINEIRNVNISNGDRIEDDYYKPSIEFVLNVTDSLLYSSQILKSESI